MAATWDVEVREAVAEEAAQAICKEVAMEVPNLGPGVVHKQTTVGEVIKEVDNGVLLRISKVHGLVEAGTNHSKQDIREHQYLSKDIVRDLLVVDIIVVHGVDPCKEECLQDPKVVTLETAISKDSVVVS